MKVVKIFILLVVAFLVKPKNLFAQSCNCKEYIYLNEPGIASVLKFEVGAGVLLSERIGSNGGTPPNQHWYPGLNSSEMPSPHGLATDLNGNLYIANTILMPSQIRKFNCDGAISPVSPSTININNTERAVFNMFSIGNIIFTSSAGGPTAYNSCTGEFLGQMCLNHTDGVTPVSTQVFTPYAGERNMWGLSYNENTQMVYVSRDLITSVYAFTKTQLEQGIQGGSCINPIIVPGSSPIVNPGENFFPSNIAIKGVVGDNLGNIYVVGIELTPNAGASYVYKYNSNGQFLSRSLPNPNLLYSHGIVWSETLNRLFVSNYTDDPAIDCISAFDANSLTYLGTAAPNPNLPTNNIAKAMAIIKECCPNNLPTSFTKYICGGNGAKFYLNQEAFNTCDGIVCGSSWVPTSLNGMTFDPCDNSVTVTGNGCSTFTLDIGGVTSTSCPPQASVFTICNSLPPTINVNVSSPCNILNNQHSISGIINMPAPPLAGTLTLSVTGGQSQTYNAPFIMPLNYSFVGLNSDGNLKIVTASFSDAPSCNSSISYMSPPECLCNISAQITALECLDNGTPTKISDNRIRFNALITNNNSNLANYNVSINGGTTITPNTNVPYGVTQFTLGAGTAGGGATFTVTVTDSATPGCTRTFQIVDPGGCNSGNPPVECQPVKCGTAAIQVNGN